MTSMSGIIPIQRQPINVNDAVVRIIHRAKGIEGMSTGQLFLGQSDTASEENVADAGSHRSVLGSIGRVARAALLAVGLTGIFLIPTLLTHIGLGLVAPISSGYMTGRLRKLSGGEAAVVGLILALCIGLPLPIAQQEFGFLSQLSVVAVIFLSGVVAVYYGALVGITAWYGGYLVREEEAEDDAWYAATSD